ncbi:MAG: UvrD-helicase domain-containing protein [Deltaproteobacteria bacterium]|nr:UvrD-helicase domain-containing protein [Deltaproteobacteria bacterium]
MTKSLETKLIHESQLARAVESLDRDAIIVANAGAGKTHLLVEHYFALLESGLEPAHVVAYTFTEKAANELRERIVRRMGTHPGFSELPEDMLKHWRTRIHAAPIGTIHQFCLKVIEASRNAGERSSYKIVDEALEGALQEGLLRAFLRRRFEAEDADALRLLEHYRIADLTRLLERYLSYLPFEAELEIPLPAPEALESSLLESLERLGKPLWDEIQGQKRRRYWLSFADMERRALELLRDPPEAVVNFLRPIQHVLVDEFQDTAPIQIRLIEALREQGSRNAGRLHLFCVGDPKQSIYRFRDVDRNLLLNTEEKIHSQVGEKFDFFVNYRSTSTVLKLVNGFTASAFPEARDSQANREDVPGTLARLVEISPEETGADAEGWAEEEARQVALAIQGLGQDLPLDRIAVLYRASTAALPLIHALKERGIPYSIRGGQNLFERQEILDLHRLLYIRAAAKHDHSVVGVLRSPLFLLSDATLLFLSRRDSKESLWEHLNRPETLEALKSDYPPEFDKANWALDRLRRWKGLAGTLSAHRLLEEALRRESWGDLYAAAYREPQRRLAIEQWMEWLQALETDDAPLRLTDTARILKEVVAMMPNKTPLGDLIGSRGSVQLLTIHAAKGLQFDTVFLIGMNRKMHVDYPLLQRVGNALALKVPDEDHKNRKTDRYQAIEAHHQAEELEEAKRLLYVAMTRAENRLILLVQPKKSKSGSLQDLLLRGLGETADLWKGTLDSGETSAIDAEIPAEADDVIPEPTADPILPLRETSVSELETFLACPLKHYYTYERQTPTAPGNLSGELGAAEIGTLLHGALNALHSRPESEIDPLIRRLLGPSLPNPEKGLVEKLENTLLSYLQSGAYGVLQKSEEDFSELPFLLQLSSGAVRGQIDRLIRVNGKWILIDFKYAEREASPRELLSAYGFQLKTYALACRRLLRENLDSSQIHVMNRGEAFEFRFSEEDLDLHEALLEEASAALRNADKKLSEIRWRPACAVCAYQRDIPVCPVPKGRAFASL